MKQSTFTQVLYLLYAQIWGIYKFIFSTFFYYLPHLSFTLYFFYKFELDTLPIKIINITLKK